MLPVRQAKGARTLRVRTDRAYPGVMAGEIGSWLSGPESPDSPGEYPGQRLGLPASGPGSVAGQGRRVAALIIDWLIAYGLAALGLSIGLLSMRMLSTAVLVIWFALGVAAVRLYGFTPGQFALGLRVASVDNRLHVGLGRAAVRGLLTALVIATCAALAFGVR